jgi:HTH-type transcriptional regulator / antitoxin HipB
MSYETASVRASWPQRRTADAEPGTIVYVRASRYDQHVRADPNDRHVRALEDFVRIANVRDLGLYIRDRRRDLHMTQAEAAAAAGVSQRWFSSLEGGKPTAEIGLVLKTMRALRLTIAVEPAETVPPRGVDLDEILRNLGPQK